VTLLEKKAKFNRILFAWHKKNYRDMAWRNTRDPYHILISEIMLQQTQVARVREKYDEFLKKFPTAKKLAKAPLGEVLRVWSGLGYNRRAKYLHECAKKVVSLYAGKFPETYEELVTLPGIGRSTAGALLAFSFDADTPMIDTNIRRILIRVFYTQNLSRSDLDIISGDRELYEFAASLIPKGKGRMWNYAMLDLGASYCSARNHSDECPLMSLHGPVTDFVYKKPQKKFKDSRRFYRGQIMKLLTKERTLPVVKLPKLLGKTRKEISPILEGLAKEHLIVIHRGKIAFP
jgi:A/G-specific adenine glycosylase